MHLRVLTCSMLLLCACEPNVVSTASGLIGSPIGLLVDPQDPDNAKAVKIVSGGNHLCALLANNRVKCWGDNESGQSYLKAARNASRKFYDVSNAQFSKIAASSHFTCGILKESALDGIPVCFGKEGEWLDVPHEKVKDLVAGPNFTCFIKSDGKLGCVGSKVLIYTKANAKININAEDLPKHGIDTVNENLDFSQKIFTTVKASFNGFRDAGFPRGKVCAQDIDGIVHCMGSNIRDTGWVPAEAEKASDYFVHDTGAVFLTPNGDLLYRGGSALYDGLNNISKPKTLKYKKIFYEECLLTAPGNTYDNGSIMPENTLICGEEVEESVLDVDVIQYHVKKMKDIPIICVLKENHKIACKPNFKSSDAVQQVRETLLIKDLPTELAY